MAEQAAWTRYHAQVAHDLADERDRLLAVLRRIAALPAEGHMAIRMRDEARRALKRP